jgi:YbbR domain-containing protein
MPGLSKLPQRLLLHNGALKLLSFVFAVALWFYVYYQMPESEEPMEVTLVLTNMPANLVRTSDIPGKINIIAKGPNAKLKQIKKDRLIYELDLANAGHGNLSFKVIDTRIKGLPLSGIRILQISPTEVTLSLAERIERTVPVEIVTRGDPAKNFSVEEKSSKPDLVKISGARGEVENLKAVATEVIDIAGLRESYEGQHQLDLRGRHIELLDAQNVRVQIEIVPDLIQREFPELPVEVENTHWIWSVTPARLDLRLKGPAEMMRSMSADKIRLVIDASDLKIGVHKLMPRVIVSGEGESESIPVGLTLPEVKLVLTKAEKEKEKK